MPSLKNTKFVAATNLLSLSVQDVIKYVQKLHQHIAKQNKRIKKLKLKIYKMVNNKFESMHLACKINAGASNQLRCFNNSALTENKKPNDYSKQ